MMAHRSILFWLLFLLPSLLLITMVLSVNIGATGLHFDALWRGGDDEDASVAWLVLTQIRAPRVVMASLTGAALGASGAIMQGLFRNPLADPGLIGISAGAGLAAACVIVLGSASGFSILSSVWAVPVAGVLGSFGATLTLYLFATREGITSITHILLAGVAFGTLAAALTGVLVFRANDTALRDLTFWTMGSFAGSTWPRIGILSPFLMGATAGVIWLAGPLNAMLLGEGDARLMGYPVERVKTVGMLTVACAVGPAVAFTGVIGFIGVVVPHLVRLITGPDHRLVLPGSVLLGAVLLTGADTLARTLASPADVPVGIVTAILGTPVFIWLLARTHDGVGV